MDNNFGIIIVFCFSINFLFGQEIETTSSYDVNLAAPLDTRLSINNLSDTAYIDYLYKGLLTYIKSIDKYYYYNNRWIELTLGTPSETSIGPVDYIDFTNNIGTQSHLEGRIFYDTINHTLTLFNGEAESSLQIGQEQRVRVYNANGVTIANGYAVSVTGITAEGIIEVGLANAGDKESAINTIGIATHDIEVGTYGWATTSGVIRDVNTSSLAEGAAIYLSDSIAGWYTTVRPSSPSYEVRMGGVVKQDAVNGELYAELRIITNTHDNFNFFTGAILESNSATITASGGVVSSVLSNSEGGDSINLIFDDGYLTVPSGISTNLTLGTDVAPVENFVYITGQGVMTTSTSSFPLSGDFVPVGRYVVPSAARSEAYGVYKSHAYADNLRGGVNGHFSHMNQWIRKRPAAWQSGVVMTTSVAEDVAVDTIDLSLTSGIVAQLHDQISPAFNTETDASFVANDFDTPYELIEGITPSIDTDSEGNSIGNNKFYNLVVWGVVSQEVKDCQVFYNLPSGSYTSMADALNDLDDYTSYTIPSAYTGTGFLISKLTIQRTNTTVKIVGITDLRGSIPIAGGGATAGGAGITSFDELTDSPISKAGSALYNLRVNATENAIEYVEPEPNFYYDDDTLSGNRNVFMANNSLRFSGGNVKSDSLNSKILILEDTTQLDANKRNWQFLGTGETFSIKPLAEWEAYGTGSPLVYSTPFELNSTTGTTYIKQLGIGTTLPSANLHVKDNMLIGSNINDGSNLGYYFRHAADNNTQGSYLKTGIISAPSGSYARSDLHFALNSDANAVNASVSDSKMVIKNSGNVGIGTTTPTEKLDVNGHIRTNNQLLVNYSAPTLRLQDTDGYSGFWHVNSNLMYLLGSQTNNATSWTRVGSYWPLYVNLGTDAFFFGGDIVQEEGYMYLKEQAAPATPASGKGALYFKTDGKLYSKNDSGAEVELGGGGGAAGTVAEQFTLICNGSSVTVGSGTYTAQNVTAEQIITTTYADITGSSITYTPPSGAQMVIFEFATNMTYKDNNNDLGHFKLFLDGTEVTAARMTKRIGGVEVDEFRMKWVFYIGGSTDTSIGRLATWTTGKTIKIQGRDYSGAYELRIHSNQWWDGANATGADIYRTPTLSITSIY